MSEKQLAPREFDEKLKQFDEAMVQLRKVVNEAGAPVKVVFRPLLIALIAVRKWIAFKVGQHE